MNRTPVSANPLTNWVLVIGIGIAALGALIAPFLGGLLGLIIAAVVWFARRRLGGRWMWLLVASLAVAALCLVIALLAVDVQAGR